MSEEGEVIGRVLAGEVDAFATLVTRYQTAVFRFVRNMLPRLHDAEDVAQEVFVSAYRGLSRFDAARGSFATWLFTIARNLCLNALKRQPTVPVPEGHDPASKRTPHDNLERSAFFESLDRALEALPLDQRTAFVLAEFVGLPGEAIARIEGVPVGTVRSRLSRAKAKLREGLREYAGGDT